MSRPILYFVFTPILSMTYDLLLGLMIVHGLHSHRVEAVTSIFLELPFQTTSKLRTSGNWETEAGPPVGYTNVGRYD